jgi:hypothetical protein
LISFGVVERGAGFAHLIVKVVEGSKSYFADVAGSKVGKDFRCGGG